jgi:hypothetical protein
MKSEYMGPPSMRAAGTHDADSPAPGTLPGWGVLLLLAAHLSMGGWGCARGEASGQATGSDIVMAGIETGAAKVANVVTPLDAVAATVESAGPDALEPGALKTVLSATVAGRTGPGGDAFDVALRTPGVPSGHARRFGTRTMRTALRQRSPDLSQFPCGACHVGTRLAEGVERSPDAHVDIRALHPAETGAACTSCHAAADVELLRLQSGDVTTLDHAYRLCAQCHFRQTDAWAAGAHGKRLDGWQGRRVVMNCTDCHDPHQPSLETRMPFRPPRLNRSSNHEP